MEQRVNSHFEGRVSVECPDSISSLSASLLLLECQEHLFARITVWRRIREFPIYMQIRLLFAAVNNKSVGWQFLSRADG